MKKNRYAWIVPVLLCLGALDLSADDAPVLPKAIASTLESEYPGWNLAPISKLLIPLDARDKYSNLLRRDFDGDGKVDLALAINYIDSENSVRTAVLVFLARAGDYQEFTLHEIWLGSDHRLVFAPGDTVLHWVRKGSPGYQVGEDEDSNLKKTTPVPVYPADAIEVISLGKAVVAFVYEDKGFKQIREGTGTRERE